MLFQAFPFFPDSQPEMYSIESRPIVLATLSKILYTVYRVALPPSMLLQ